MELGSDITQRFEDRQKFVAAEVSLSQEEKMAVADSGGCAQGNNQPLFAPLERMVQLGIEYFEF
jgi:hypothetical protein